MYGFCVNVYGDISVCMRISVCMGVSVCMRGGVGCVLNLVGLGINVLIDSYTGI